MMGIAEWLVQLGLGRYASAFAANDIDWRVLPKLTADDLKELGVTLGHRKLLLDAIAELKSAEPSFTAAPEGERRFLTVMFCDLVGSTALADAMDAEDWHRIVADYHAMVAEAVSRFGGYVAQKYGDGAMVYFGYPTAQENDAERAIHSGLAILSGIASLNERGGPELAVRIGLHVGSMVVTDQAAVYGSVPNVASRVQAAAEPGSLLISADLHRLVAGLFHVEDCGPHTLKGIIEPLRLFRVLRRSGARRQLSHRAYLTPLVNREEELGMLAVRWHRTCNGEGQAILIDGDPGLGKSRLVEEFRRGIADQPNTWLELRCSQLMQNTPLHPWVEWARLRFGGSEVPAERRLNDLARTLKSVGMDPKDSVGVLAASMGIPPSPAYPAPPVSPEELRRRQFTTLLGWIIGSARQQPMVAVVEDLHWADPSTLEFLRMLVDQIGRTELLLLMSARPEFHSPWPRHSNFLSMTLPPLGREEIRRMVTSAMPADSVTDLTVEAVIDRASGVPLFVEEVTRLLAGHRGTDQADLVPASLKASLTARLDRLGAARELAKIGAVIGREFDYPLIRKVSGWEDPLLQAALTRLIDSDLLHVQGAPPISTYRFKHALIRDAAYESLLKSKRRELHKTIARALQEEFAALASDQPELLAIHLTEAGDAEAASAAWQKAGAAALAKSAYPETVAQLGKALELLRGLPDSAERDRAELQLQLDIGQAQSAMRSWVAPETIDAYARARELAGRLGQTHQKFRSMVGQYFVCNQKADFAAANGLCDEMLRLAEGEGNAGYLSVAHRFRGSTAFFCGDLEGASEHLGRGLALYDPLQHAALSRGIGFEGTLATRATFGYAELFRGKLGAAKEIMAAAEADAWSSANAISASYVLCHDVHFHYLLGDYPLAAAKARRVQEYCRANHVAVFALLSQIFGSLAEAHQEDAPRHSAVIGRAVEMWAATRTQLHTPLLYAYLAKVMLLAGNPAIAVSAMAQAQKAGLHTSEHIWAPEIYRIEGETVLAGKQPDFYAAEACFRRALELATEMGSPFCRQRAALSLAELLAKRKQPAAARELLAPIHAGFRPEDCGADHAAAGKLLNRL
jgi:class 3 adenylate cyclase/tetratricopeptide (TPR) repeat protein